MGVAKVYAKFTGKNRSLGYLKGKKYHLNMAILSTGLIEVAPEGNAPDSKEEPCQYATLHSFNANWQVLG